MRIRLTGCRRSEPQSDSHDFGLAEEESVIVRLKHNKFVSNNILSGYLYIPAVAQLCSHIFEVCIAHVPHLEDV